MNAQSLTKENCKKKKRFKSEEMAIMFSIAAASHGNPILRVYKCNYCRDYHLTSKRKI